MEKYIFQTISFLFLVSFLSLATPLASHANDIKGLVEELRIADGNQAKLQKVIGELVKVGPNAIPELLDSVNDDDQGVRANVVLAFANIGGEAAQQALIQRLAKDNSGLVRHIAGYFLWEGPFDLSHLDDVTLLNAAFEEFLHSEFLATLAGFKPISVVKGFQPAIFERLMKAAVRKNLLTNNDIGWFFRTDKPAKVVHFYSRSALANLIQNTDLVELLTRNGFPKVASVDEAIVKFKEFWFGKIPVSQESFDIVSGIFFGYPREEVLAYATSRSGGIQASGYNKKIFPELGRENFFGWLVVSTGQSENEIKDLTENIRKAVEVYHSAVRAGVTALEIINGWQAIACTAFLTNIK